MIQTLGTEIKGEAAWIPVGARGHDLCHLARTSSGWKLEGNLEREVVTGNLALEYRVLCDRGWSTRAVHLNLSLADHRRSLQLTADNHGHWWVQGRAAAELAGCMDVDLNLTPATNTLPVRRLDLEIGQSADVLAAWVILPSMEHRAVRQRYSRIGPKLFRYQNQDSGFRVEFSIDDSGFVEDYPGQWRRIR